MSKHLPCWYCIYFGTTYHTEGICAFIWCVWFCLFFLSLRTKQTSWLLASVLKTELTLDSTQNSVTYQWISIVLYHSSQHRTIFHILIFPFLSSILSPFLIVTYIFIHFLLHFYNWFCYKYFWHWKRNVSLWQQEIAWSKHINTFTALKRDHHIDLQRE